MKRVFVSLVLMFLVVSCSVDDDANNFKLETLPIKEAIVPDAFNFGSSHDITVIYDLPSGCHSFYDLFYQYEGTSRIVAINSLVNEADVCTGDLREIEYTFRVNVVQREDYIFKFWKGVDGDGENVFEEVIVPVNQ